jgi:hypothetical protein
MSAAGVDGEIRGWVYGDATNWDVMAVTAVTSVAEAGFF